jgi:hypothetical protein
MQVEITGYTWLDASRVRVSYRFRNVGAATVTSLKATAGFDGRTPNTWNRTETYAPNTSRSMSSVFPSNMSPSFPNTFRIKIVQVNGVIDENTANNEASILIVQ